VCVQVELAAEDEQELAAEMAAQFLQDDLPEETFGVAKAGAGMWSSIIRIVHPISGKTLQMVELPQNEAAFRFVDVFSLMVDSNFLQLCVGAICQSAGCHICACWRSESTSTASTLVGWRLFVHIFAE
jgi:hypothetical protein